MAKKRRWFRWWIVPIAVLAGGIAVTVYYSDQSERRFREELALCRKAGLATEPNDMRRNVPAASENAAGHYQLAMSRLKSLSADAKDYVKDYVPGQTEEERKRLRGYRYSGPLTPERKSRLLGEWKPVFDAIADASKRPRLDFGRRWEMGAALILPEYAELKSIAKGLAIDAADRANRGDFKGALDRIRQARMIGVHCFDEPTMISQLVGTSLINQANRAALELALERPNNKVLREAVQHYFDRKPDLQDSRRALMGESLMLAHGVDDYIKDGVGTGDDDQNAQARFLRFKAIRRAVQTSVLRSHRETFTALPEDRYDWKTSEKVFADLDKKIASDQSVVGQLSSIFTPVFGGFGSVPRRSVQTHQLAQAALAVLAAKQATGQYPGALPSLGEKGIDLYSGKPLIYKSMKDGFVLYSVGVNKKDESGENGDMTVRVTGTKVEIRGG